MQNHYFALGVYIMRVKNGFLLIEIASGFTLFCFLLFIIFHYIIHVKNIQQGCLTQIKALSLARNCVEKIYANPAQYNTQTMSTKFFSVAITPKSFLRQSTLPISTLTVSWKEHAIEHTLTMPLIDRCQNESSHEV